MAEEITYKDKDGNERTAPAILLTQEMLFGNYLNTVSKVAEQVEIQITEIRQMGHDYPSFHEHLIHNTQAPKNYSELLEHAVLVTEKLREVQRLRQQLLLAGGMDVINSIVDVLQDGTDFNFSGQRMTARRG